LYQLLTDRIVNLTEKITLHIETANANFLKNETYLDGTTSYLM